MSRFDEVRKAIQKVAADLGRAVYQAEEDQGFVYDQVVWVGHSLGSVIAYDTVNTLVNEDLALTRRLRVAERTTSLLTVASPLDKTAFLFRSQRPDPLDVREGLASARQPLIVDYALRPDRWINLHSPQDWIGGALAYYDARPEPGAPADVQRLWRQRRVRNHRDPRARTPLAAHVELFENELFGRTLFRVLSGGR